MSARSELEAQSEKVAIIMATYNSAAYVAEQLESILKQTHQNWHLYVRDDGSKDNSLEILEKYAQRDQRITVVRDDLGNLKYNKGYLYLLSKTTEGYISFCDADDVMHPTRIAKMLARLKQKETVKKKPVLVHTDARVVDAQLNLIVEKFIGERGNKLGLNGILFANSVSGSSLAINAAFRDYILANPPEKLVDHHLDYYLALMAELIGERSFIDEALLEYRQHQNNTVGTVGAQGKQQKLGKYTLSLLAGLIIYYQIRNVYAKVNTSNINQQLLQDYFYLFEGKSRFKKIWIFLKNRYTFTRKKDLLTFIYLLVSNQDLREIAGQPSQ